MRSRLFHADLSAQSAIRKTGDGSILRPETRSSPVSASTGGTPLQKISKVVAPRDTELDFWRELTDGNLFLFQGSSEKETRRLYLLKPDNHRISLDRKSGQAFLDHEIFTKGYWLDFHSGKTWDRSILRVESRDSPRTASTRERPPEKWGVANIFSRHECGVSRHPSSRLFYWYGSCGFLLVALREPDL